MWIRQTTLTIAAAAVLSLSALPAEAQPAHCPPGLAKKAVPCVPPGQARKFLRVGDPLPRDHVVIEDYWRYGLERPVRGTRYVRVDDTFWRVAIETSRIIDSVRVIGGLLD